MARFPIEQWQANLLRLTVFPPLNANNDQGLEWWQRMTGIEPSESSTDRKRNMSQVSGEFGDGNLTLSLAPERIDWFLTAAEGLVNPTNSIESIGPMIQSVDQFSALAESWLAEEDVPEVTRLAFGAVLIHPEVDHAAGYTRLRDYVPIPVDPDWRDFAFQVNIRNPGLADYGIAYVNRLSRWSVAVQTSGRVNLSPQGIAVAGIGTPKYGLRLELDINTPADSVEVIPRQNLAGLYRELVAISRAIASDGVAHEQYRLQ